MSYKNEPLVSIIILTQNRRKVFEKCFNSVLSQDYPNKEVIIVDNGSSDYMIDFLKSQAEKENFRLILNEINRGACLGRNQGFKESTGEYLLFLDSDVVLVDKSTISYALEEMIKYDNLEELGGIGFLDERLSKIQHGILKFCRGFNLDKNYLNQIPSEIDFDVDYIQSDFALVRRGAFEKIGGFDPLYFYYPEDVDLSFRLKRLGFRIAITPKVKFWHRYLPRRSELNHDYFYKVIYLFFKNFSISEGLKYYFYFLRDGLNKIRKNPNRIKVYFLMSWYALTPLFVIWLFFFWVLIKLRKQINFLYEADKFFSISSEKILRFPILLENKFIALISRVLFWIKRKRGKRGLYLFVTNRCNYSCIHCFLGGDTKVREKELTVSEIQKAYNSLRKKIGGVSITGGEPFLREDIVEICKIFQEPPFVSGIFFNTNGFAPDLITNQVKKILANAPKKQKIIITVSLDGLEEMHDKIRTKKSAFKSATKTIRLLKKLEQGNPNFRVRAQCTLMEINYKDFHSLFNLISNELRVDFNFNWFRDGRACGVDQSLILEPLPTQDNSSCKLPSMEKCEEVCEFLLENQWEDLNLNLINKYTLEILRDKKFIFPCVAPELNLVIYANGDVSFCELVKPIRNIREFDYDLKKILKSKKWKKISAAVKKCFCIHPCILGINLQKKHFIDVKLESMREFREKN